MSICSLKHNNMQESPKLIQNLYTFTLEMILISKLELEKMEE